MKQIKISPSILSADFTNISKAVFDVSQAGADYLHCDVMDGNFVNNITFGMKMIKDIKKISPLPLDVHLMIIEPERYIQQFCNCGADIITIHAESTEKIDECIDEIKFNKKLAGLAISPDTKLVTIEEFLYKIDLLLIMSVNPGFSNQMFIKDTLIKIKNANNLKLKNNYSYDIEVDGGVNLENAKTIIEKGADILVSGSVIFESENKKETIKTMRLN